MFKAHRVVTFDQPIERNELLTQLSETLKADGLVKESFIGGLLARESEFPTGIFMETHSMAIPHTEFEHVNKTGFAIGINKAGVTFQRTDDPDEEVVPEIIVMMAIDPTCEKVAIIQSLFALLADVDQVHTIGQMSPEEIAELFTHAVSVQ